MKKNICALAIAAVTMFGMMGCGTKSNVTENNLKVGMVTDSGTIDDKSFNQGAWEGISNASEEFALKNTYIKPNGNTIDEFLKEIGNLVDSNYNFIITPGSNFSKTISLAQEKYPNTDFVLIDGVPTDEEGNQKIGEHTLCVSFAEHEAGFLAGIATALKLGEGDVGFVGGMKVPAVQKYNWGFQQGIIYANENLNTNIEMKKENFIYQGTFTDVAAGQQIASTMFSRGVKAILHAGGGVGVGVINEAKTRNVKGEEVWVLGVDIDQYEDGVYGDGKSVILTSAVKNLTQATYDIILDKLENKFEGGKIVLFDVSNDGVGIPQTNPNLSDEIISKVNDVCNKIRNGDIKVSSEQNNLFA